jgi:hypothetical protein
MGMADRLKAVSASAKTGKLKVGFFANATYPDSENGAGDYVANVAFKNEFGSKENPPRPFFRMAIERNRSKWGADLAAAYANSSGNFGLAIRQLGHSIADQIKLSITDYDGINPTNSRATIERKGFDKPLTDTGIMAKSVGYEAGE